MNNKKRIDMKELSIEEKAKAYERVAKEVKDFFEGRQKMYSDVEQTLEYLFPELKESEDESIRKRLIELLKKNDEQHFAKEIAWLEKQAQNSADTDNKFIRMRETKPKDISEFLDRLTTVEQEFLWEHIAKIRELDKEEQGEQEPADKIEPKFNVGDKIQYLKGCGTIMTIKKIENGEYIFANNMGHTTIESGNKWYLVEQNHAWSEEDEKYLKLAIENFQMLGNSFLTAWIKSLKNRVQPLPKQEWSEEDTNLREATIGLLNLINPIDAKSWGKSRLDCIDWLKSLRPQNKYAYNPYKAVVESIAAMVKKYDPFDSNLQDFYDNVKVKCKDAKEYDSLYSQSQWRPSDAQMASITCAVRKMKESACYDSELVSLYQDLKKLREE